MKKSEVFWQTYLNLERELLDVAKYIYITDEVTTYNKGVLVSNKTDRQLETFSPFLADLLIRVCVEIEAISKELFFELVGDGRRGDRSLRFDEDCLKTIDQNYKTHKKVVLVSCPLFNITRDENKSFKPLREAHKRQGVDWNKAYQALKHDRFASLSKGTVKSFLHAMGALYLLNVYYRDIKMVSKYLDVNSLDYSLGSSVFAVEKPDQKYVISIINNQDYTGILEADGSPFILKYTDSCYTDILKANNDEIKNMQQFLESQPEMADPEFFKQLAMATEKEKADSSKRVMIIWELCKYRLHKKVPDTLPFEERKRILVSTPEWNGRIRLQNKHIEADELSEENIQSEIDLAGIHYGMELQLGFGRMKMDKAFRDGSCEIVLDKGNVRYKKN